jgi:dienelactone hydrolase
MMKTSLWILSSVFIGLVTPDGLKAEVIRSNVEEKGLVADFYCSGDATNKPGIMLLGGSSGGRPGSGLAEFFAENGYPVLAVAYFKDKGLPDSLQMIPLEYFDKAITWIQRNKKIPPGGIIVVGESKGAELALVLASRKPQIKGVIALAPSSVVWEGMSKESKPPPSPCSSWSLNGKPVPFVPYDFSQGYAAGDSLAICKFFRQALTQKEAVEKATIKAEQIHGPVLLASGHDDIIWPAEEMADAICSRLKKKGFKYKCEHLKYKDAGHSFNEHHMLGGTLEGNKKARIDLPERMLVFLKTFDGSSARTRQP